MNTEKLTIEEHMNITDLAHEMYASYGGGYSRKRVNGVGFNPVLAYDERLFAKCMDAANAATNAGAVSVRKKSLDLIADIIDEEVSDIEFTVNHCYVSGRGELGDQISQLILSLEAQRYWSKFTTAKQAPLA